MRALRGCVAWIGREEDWSADPGHVPGHVTCWLPFAVRRRITVS